VVPATTTEQAGGFSLAAVRTKGRSTARFVLALFAMLGPMAVAAPGAGAHLYWPAINYMTFGQGQIGRADLDGGGVQEAFIGGADVPTDIAVDPVHVYWADGATIARANLDGSGVEPHFMDVQAQAIAVDGSHLYWTDTLDGYVGRANLDGSGGDPTFITGAENPLDVQVDGSHVYWQNGGPADFDIGRANLDGSGVNQHFLAGAGENGCAIAVDGGHVYWTDSVDEQIGRANLDGSGVESSFISGTNGDCGLAVDSTSIYWSSQATHTIGRASIGGGGASNSFIGPLAEPFYPNSVAVDGGGGSPVPTPMRVPPAGPIAPAPGSGSGSTFAPNTKLLKARVSRRLRKATFTFRATGAGSAAFQCKLDRRRFAKCRSPKTYKGLKKGKHVFQVRAIGRDGRPDSTPARDAFRI